MVQVFLESVGTLEGDMLVSGVQAAAARRMAAVWNELEGRYKRGEMVKGGAWLHDAWRRNHGMARWRGAGVHRFNLPERGRRLSCLL